MEVYNTELSLYNMGLSPAIDGFQTPQNRQIEFLWACINAIKAWQGIFFSIAPADYVGFSPLIYSHMLYCFIGIQRLSTFEHSDWDRTLFQDQLDVTSYLDQLERNFAAVKEEAGLDIGGSEHTDSFNCMASRLRALKVTWGTASDTSATGTGNDGLYDLPMEFSDEDWLRELLRS